MHWNKVNLDYKTRKGSGFFKILILFSPHSRNVVWRLLYKEQKMNQTYMKEKKIFPLVMSMALPMMLSMAFNSLYNIVDSYFVAKLSEDAMTALSLVYPAQNLLTAVAVGFGVGVNAMISF